MRDISLLYQWFDEARQQLVEIGFPYVECEIKLNSRLKVTLGQSYDLAKKIEINKDYFLHGNEENIKDTIMHELTHQLAPKESHHDNKWHDIVNYINKYLGMNIQQYATSKDYDYKVASGKYVILKCIKCGNVHSPTKMHSKGLDYMLEKYLCGNRKCNGKLEVYNESKSE